MRDGERDGGDRRADFMGERVGVLEIPPADFPAVPSFDDAPVCRLGVRALEVEAEWGGAILMVMAGEAEDEAEDEDEADDNPSAVDGEDWVAIDEDDDGVGALAGDDMTVLRDAEDGVWACCSPLACVCDLTGVRTGMRSGPVRRDEEDLPVTPSLPAPRLKRRVGAEGEGD